MPLIRSLCITNGFELIVWKIEESPMFFLNKASWSNAELAQLRQYKSQNRQLQFLASRYLIKKILGNEVVIYKDECGCPQTENVNISISHTNSMACLLYSENHRVGIDLEPFHEKVKRVKHKFLTEEELAFINPKHETEQLIACWSAKETIFKYYGKGNLPFKNNIKILPFDYMKDGRMKINLTIKEVDEILTVSFVTIENHILTYIYK